MSETVKANDGADLPLDSLPQTLIYDGDFISEIFVNYQGSTYIQTFLNDGVNITYISGWVNPDYNPGVNQLMIDENQELMITEDGNTMITENML